MRTIAIWIFGLLGSCFLGALIDAHFDAYGNGTAGAVGAMLIFACLRLWLARPASR